MSNVFQLAATGIPDLANVILSYRSTPVIGGTPASGILLNAVTGGIALASGVYLYAETYEEVAQADVSQQLILAADGTRKWVADNIAPQPRVWNITGYLKAMIANIVPIPTAYLAGFNLSAQKQKLLTMQKQRATFPFKTTDNELVQSVAIVDLHFSPIAQSGNTLPFQIKLQEVPYLTVTESDVSDVSMATPPAGGANGDPAAFGSVPASRDTSYVPLRAQ